MSQSQENVRTDRKANGRKNRQTLFYRTLPAEAGGPTTSLQQVTGGNTPILVLKRMLRYFLRIPPLKTKRKLIQKRKLQIRKTEYEKPNNI